MYIQPSWFITSSWYSYNLESSQLCKISDSDFHRERERDRERGGEGVKKKWDFTYNQLLLPLKIHRFDSGMSIMSPGPLSSTYSVCSFAAGVAGNPIWFSGSWLLLNFLWSIVGSIIESVYLGFIMFLGWGSFLSAEFVSRLDSFGVLSWGWGENGRRDQCLFVNVGKI